MRPKQIDSRGGTERRRATTARGLLALLCAIGLVFASLLSPAAAGNAPRSEAGYYVGAFENVPIKSGKRCQHSVPGAVGTCNAGVSVGVEAAWSAVIEMPRAGTGIAPFAQSILLAQWLGVPQFRPPRIDA